MGLPNDKASKAAPDVVMSLYGKTNFSAPYRGEADPGTGIQKHRQATPIQDVLPLLSCDWEYPI